MTKRHRSPSQRHPDGHMNGHSVPQPRANRGHIPRASDVASREALGLCSRSEARRLLGGISRWTLARMEQAGELPRVLLPRGTGTVRRALYRREDVERLAAGHAPSGA